ncbi:MAG: [Fe-Fe] hydrogenase large subunit C-terminal domain-containing protein [Bacteroidia bacterium]|nr:[Fe-Fe] hydrogenase large subunit C-terminal domain-containing protein [Bacteroidia bacterium]
MKDRNYTHAIQIDTDQCIGCSHCMQVCPTQAIRIIVGHADIMPERCVDCGECYRVCPVGAIYVEDDGLSVVKHDAYRIALVPSVFIGQFPSEHTASEILDAVKQIGFDEVFEVEQAVDFMKDIYDKIVDETDYSLRPIIGSFCPAIVRLIQVYYHSLTDQILQIKAPLDIAALYLRKSKAKENINPDNINIYYITACAAKIVAAKAPVGEKVSPIYGTIDMKEVFNLVSKTLIEKKDSKLSKQFANMSPDSVKWSLSGTEKQYFRGRSLAIDGMENVVEFLDRLESGRISGVDFLEMRACDQGCAGGILCPGNRFLTVERLEQREKKLASLAEKYKSIKNDLMDYAKEMRQTFKVDPVYPRDGLLLDEDMEIALQKMDRIKKLNSYLPGFDCGACGAPTCRSLAEDIVKEKATISYCVFVQRVMEKNYNLSPDQAFQTIERIWGKDRLKKYQHSNGKVES